MESTLPAPATARGRWPHSQVSSLAALAAGGLRAVRRAAPAAQMRRQARARFARLTRGAVIDFAHASNLGIDERWLYVVDHWAVDEQARAGERLAPARYRLDDIRSLAKGELGRRPLVLVGLSGDQGRVARICCPVTDTAARDRVHEALRQRFVPPEPASPRNAPSPLSALLRTIAPREWDALHFQQRHALLPPGLSGDPLQALRACAEPRVVFSIRHDAGPGREQWFRELFRAWGRKADLGAVEGAAMPAFLQGVAAGAGRVGLKLWLVDTGSPDHAGFLAVAGRDGQIRTLCRHAGIDLLT